MKKTKWILGVVVAALIIGMTGCAAIAAALAAPYGYVYDGRTGDPVSGVTVQLKDTSGTVQKTTTTSSTGYYSFSSVDYGEFELVASGTNYTFIEQPVEVTGIAQQLPNIAGISTNIDGDTSGSGDDLVEGILTIVTFWDTDFDDVDTILTFPNTDVNQETFDADGTDFYNPDDGTSTAGFFPNTTTGRTRLDKASSVYPSGNAKNTTSGAEIWLESDNSGAVGQTPGGPETITVFWPPAVLDGYLDTAATKYVSGVNDASGLPAGSYSCIGVMEYYLDAADTSTKLSSSDNSAAANPVTYVFDGTNQIARFTLPLYTSIERASVFRINIFVDDTAAPNEIYYYQILPDTKVYDDFDNTNLRAINNQNKPVVIKGRSRN